MMKMSLDKNLDNLNFGISTVISEFLQTKDLLKLCFLNQRWLSIGKNPIIWKYKFRSEWVLFTSAKPETWTYLKWVSYINKNDIILEKVGTLFTLTEKVGDDWSSNIMTPQLAVKFSLPVKTIDIFREEVWAVDIYGGLSLIFPNERRYADPSKLWRVFNFRHLERRTFNYPLQNIVTISNLAVLLYCNNQCEIFHKTITSPVVMSNVKLVGVVNSEILYYLNIDGQLYHIGENFTSFSTDNVRTVFDATTCGTLHITYDNDIEYYDDSDDEYTVLEWLIMSIKSD